MTEMDDLILEVLSSGLTLTPAVIAENIDRDIHRTSVARRVSTLQAGGFVEKVRRGHYRAAGHVTVNADGEVVDVV